MIIDKKLQEKIGFTGQDMSVEVQMDVDTTALHGSGNFAEIET